MNIRFTSSLTPDDENTLAPALLKTLAGILDLLPIAYIIRIDTTDSQVYQHSSTAGQAAGALDVARRTVGQSEAEYR